VESFPIKLPLESPVSFSNRTLTYRDHAITYVRTNTGHEGVGYSLGYEGAGLVDDPYNGRLTNATVREKTEIVAAVRQEIGYDADLAFDCHWDGSVESAKRLAHELEEFDPIWLEDLIPPENMDAQKG